MPPFQPTTSRSPSATTYSAAQPPTTTTPSSSVAFIHMIGSAWLRYEEWAKVDPEELILGGNNDGLPLWKAGPDGLEAITRVDRLLCGSCDIANFARQFYSNGNLALFRRLHRSGVVYTIDRRPYTVGAHIFDVATQPQSQYYDSLGRRLPPRIDYYDDNIRPCCTRLNRCL